MRIRNNKINVLLSNEENFILKIDSEKLNLSQSKYIRSLIIGYEIKILYHLKKKLSLKIKK